VTYPVAVVIPTIPSRREFLENHCLPSVRAARPEQVIVVREGGNANEKRNAGAAQAETPYLLFVDDDCVLEPHCILSMYESILGGDEVFAYSDYDVVVHPGVVYPFPGRQRCGGFSRKALRIRNYIDTTSLIRRDRFPGFDPAIRRFQDWDFWLTVVAAGGIGRYIPDILFESHKIDAGVTTLVPETEAREAIVRKHGL
jgi:glycosyltransferase involved in cell wall biosynthesis